MAKVTPLPVPVPDKIVSKFWAKVDIGSPNECWHWLGAKSPRGYGTLGDRRATHVSLAIDGRPRPGDLQVMHSCDNPPCVNPAHLRWGTALENSQDKLSKGRHARHGPDYCNKKHRRTEANTSIRYKENGNSFKICLTCKSQADAKRTARRAQERKLNGTYNLRPVKTEFPERIARNEAKLASIGLSMSELEPTQCRHGHEVWGHNLIIKIRGDKADRICGICKRTAKARRPLLSTPSSKERQP